MLAFTSPSALHECLAGHPGTHRRVPFRDLAGIWPNVDWWLAVNPGLPIEGYLPSWFVTQISRGDVRLPGRTLGARARMEQASSKTRAVAQVPLRTVPNQPAPTPIERQRMRADQVGAAGQPGAFAQPAAAAPAPQPPSSFAPRRDIPPPDVAPPRGVHAYARRSSGELRAVRRQQVFCAAGRRSFAPGVTARTDAATRCSDLSVRADATPFGAASLCVASLCAGFSVRADAARAASVTACARNVAHG